MRDAGALILAASGRTAVGRSLLASAAAVRAGVARLGCDPVLRDGRDRPLVTARAAWLPHEWPSIDRVVGLARPAAFEALAVLRGGPKRAIRAFVGVPSASREGRIDGLDDAVRRLVEEAVARAGRLEELELVRADHASGFLALGSAMKRLNRDDALCLVGGVDSWLDEETIGALASDNRLKSPRQPFGFSPGEAAGFILVERRGTTGLTAMAAVRACASAVERAAVNVGEALSGCCLAVLERLREDERAGRIVVDLNGEPSRADELGMTLVRCGGRVARDAALVLAPARHWGDVGAASAPLALGLAVVSRARGWGAERTLVCASSPACERGAAVVTGPDA